MVDVDEALPELTVLFAKVDCANCAGSAVMPDTFIASMAIQFVPVYKNLRSLAFSVFGYQTQIFVRRVGSPNTLKTHALPYC